MDLRAAPEVVARLKDAATKDYRSLSAYLTFYGLQAADQILGKEVQQSAEGAES
jgi:hypothetical protein